MIWSVNPPWTIYKSVEFLIDLGMVSAIIATIQAVGECRRFVNWTWTLLGVLIVTAWMGALIDPSDALFSDPGLHFAPLPLRLVGLVPVVSCNDLSEMSAILALVALCRIFLSEDSQRGKTRYWCLFGAAFVTLVVTQTRGAFLAFLVGLVALLILARRYILVTIGGVTSFIVAIPLLFLTKFGTTLQDFLLRGEKAEEATGMSGRLETWQMSFDKIAQHPLSGYGGFAGAKFLVLSKNSVASDTLSSYIDSLLNIGVCGLAILMIVMIWVGYLLFRSIRDSRLSESENHLALEMFVAFIVVAIRSVESSNLVTHPMLPFLTILGVAELLRRSRKQGVLHYSTSDPSLI
jgi:O-antigen ligase